MGTKTKQLELTNRATRDLAKFKEFYYELYGLEKADAIIENIFHKLEILENPDIDLTKVGAIDNTFLHSKHTYRKLIIKYCKITYRWEIKNLYC